MLAKLNSKPVFWYSTGTIIRQLSAFIMLPIYTQYLSPSEYGVVGLLALILGLYELFLGARFGSALPKFYFERKSENDKHLLISSSLIFTCLISCLGGALFAACSNLISTTLFERPELSLLVAIYGVSLVTSSIEEYTLAYMRLRDRPFYFFTLSMLKLAIQLSLNIYFVVYEQMGVAGVIWGTLIASVILAFISAFYTIFHTGLTFDNAVVKQLWTYCWPLWFAGLGSIYISLVTNFIIKFFCSLEDVGLYHFALKFSSLIAALVWRPFNQWWQTERFRIAEDSKNPQAEFGAAFIVISCTILIAINGISFGSSVIIDFMTAPAYYEAKKLVPILCLMVLFGQLNFFVHFPFLKVGNTKFFPKLKAIKAIVTTIAVSLSAYYFDIKAVVISLAVIQFLDFVVTYTFGQRHYEQGIDIVRFLSIAIFTAVYVTAGVSMIISVGSLLYQSLMIVGLILTFILGIGVHLLLLPNRKFVWHFVKNKMLK